MLRSERRNEGNWRIAVGHHPVGGSYCGAEGALASLRSLLEAEDGTDVYLNGHVHAMDYGLWRNVSYITSGAGADASGINCVSGGEGPMWSVDKTAGFVSVELSATAGRADYWDEYGTLLYSASIPFR